MALNFGYNTVNALTSNESNNTVGIGSQSFGGPGYRNNGLVSGLPDSLVGYRAGTPGATWVRLGQNLPLTVAMDVELGPDGKIYAATHGRGIWSIQAP